jgi:hypothetical protein
MSTRLKDINWQPGTDKGAAETWQHVQVAVLMDIRDELKRLNLLLYCTNFTGIPQVLRKVEKNTRKKRRAKPLRIVRSA